MLNCTPQNPRKKVFKELHERDAYLHSARKVVDDELQGQDLCIYNKEMHCERAYSCRGRDGVPNDRICRGALSKSLREYLGLKEQ